MLVSSGNLLNVSSPCPCLAALAQVTTYHRHVSVVMGWVGALQGLLWLKDIIWLGCSYQMFKLALSKGPLLS